MSWEEREEESLRGRGSCGGASGCPPRSRRGSRDRPCPPWGEGKEPVQVSLVKGFFQRLIQSFSVRAPLPKPPSIPPPHQLPLQGHCKITFREKHGALETFPLLPPLTFFPGRERRPYLLLFSPSARDNALIDTLFGKSRLAFPFWYR